MFAYNNVASRSNSTGPIESLSPNTSVLPLSRRISYKILRQHSTSTSSATSALVLPFTRCFRHGRVVSPDMVIGWNPLSIQLDPHHRRLSWPCMLSSLVAPAALISSCFIFCSSPSLLAIKAPRCSSRTAIFSAGVASRCFCTFYQTLTFSLVEIIGRPYLFDLTRGLQSSSIPSSCSCDSSNCSSPDNSPNLLLLSSSCRHLVSIADDMFVTVSPHPFSHNNYRVVVQVRDRRCSFPPCIFFWSGTALIQINPKIPARLVPLPSACAFYSPAFSS